MSTMQSSQVRCILPFVHFHYRFTGKKTDSESGLDYFGARYYGSALGRFSSPDYVGDGLDPAPVPRADFSNPQSLNLYGYVGNHPLTNSDPDGNDCVVQTRNSATTETVTVSSGNCDKVNVGDGETKSYINGMVDVRSIKGDGSGGITFGYTPSSGSGSSGVADLASAPIPENTGLAYGWGNNAQGYRTLAAAGETVGSVKGAALSYGASAATATCALFCGEAAAALDAAQNQLALKAVAYLEPNGIPATKAAEMIIKMGVATGQSGVGAAFGQGWKQLAPKLNDAVRNYRQSQPVH